MSQQQQLSQKDNNKENLTTEKNNNSIYTIAEELNSTKTFKLNLIANSKNQQHIIESDMEKKTQNKQQVEYSDTKDNHRQINNENKGDTIESKGNNNIRIMFQNINSLRPQNLEKWKATIDRSNHLQCDIVGICETGVNWNKKNLTETYRKCLRRIKRNSTVEVSCARCDYQNKSMPGGTATLIMGKWASRMISPIIDTSGIGRWSGISIRVNESTALHYITAYRVCKQKITLNNSLSTYTQQYRNLELKGIKEPNPRKQILTDLTELWGNLTKMTTLL